MKKQFLIVLLFSLLAACSTVGCSTQDDDFHMVRTNVSAGFAGTASRKSEADIARMKEINSELEALLADMESLAVKSEQSLSRCEAQAKKYGIVLK